MSFRRLSLFNEKLNDNLYSSTMHIDERELRLYNTLSPNTDNYGRTTIYRHDNKFLSDKTAKCLCTHDLQYTLRLGRHQ